MNKSFYITIQGTLTENPQEVKRIENLIYNEKGIEKIEIYEEVIKENE